MVNGLEWSTISHHPSNQPWPIMAHLKPSQSWRYTPVYPISYNPNWGWFMALGLPHYTIPGHHNVEYFIAICMGTTSMQENGARVAGKWLLQRGKHCNYTNSSWPNFQLIICIREAPVWTMTQVPSELTAWLNIQFEPFLEDSKSILVHFAWCSIQI